MSKLMQAKTIGYNVAKKWCDAHAILGNQGETQFFQSISDAVEEYHQALNEAGLGDQFYIAVCEREFENVMETYFRGLVEHQMREVHNVVHVNFKK